MRVIFPAFTVRRSATSVWNLDVFAEHFHCYVLEFPGFGVSDPVGGSPMFTATESVTRFMDALGIESAAIIGNSMGGVVGAHVAMQHPERVEKLITIGGVGPNIFSQSPSEGTRLLRDFADAPSREKLVRWLECMVYDPAVVTEEHIEERWETAKDPDSHKTLAAMYGYVDISVRSVSCGSISIGLTTYSAIRWPSIERPRKSSPIVVNCACGVVRKSPVSRVLASTTATSPTACSGAGSSADPVPHPVSRTAVAAAAAAIGAIFTRIVSPLRVFVFPGRPHSSRCEVCRPLPHLWWCHWV
ncbi:4,5:9,10-diseco-3-hydroxy-5,9, 17-trioxoandrosta-1(10),2-diene-4-oate hydrolase [Rhodococcus sp. Br-6]|nr:4,5:9,10-diseco-3-hydroxy-5,9, 17-trioxoandrosta-1(10),2-diene-4-oate hydrolase [Rhodococcus sp. Br-6]